MSDPTSILAPPLGKVVEKQRALDAWEQVEVAALYAIASDAATSVLAIPSLRGRLTDVEESSLLSGRPDVVFAVCSALWARVKK